MLQSREAGSQIIPAFYLSSLQLSLLFHGCKAKHAMLFLGFTEVETEADELEFSFCRLLIAIQEPF